MTETGFKSPETEHPLTQTLVFTKTAGRYNLVEVIVVGLLYDSGKPPTYPSPKLIFCSKSEVSVNVGSGEG